MIPAGRGVVVTSMVATAMVLASLGTAARAVADEATRLGVGDFAQGRVLEPGSSRALQSATLDLEVYRASVEPGLADLRVFNAAGETVPHAIRAAPPAAARAAGRVRLPLFPLADLETAERALDKVNRPARAGDKAARALADLLEQVLAHLGTGAVLRQLALDDEARGLLKPWQFISAKPVLYVANVNEIGGKEQALVEPVRRHAQAENAQLVVLCAAMEAELAELSAADQAEFLADLGQSEPGLNRLVRAGYTLLDLLTFFTAGPKEVRAWTVPSGATAPMAAGRIHTDFEKGFIRAEVTSYDDFVACGGETGARAAGKLRLEGRDYVVAEADVMHFRFNV